MPIAPLEIGSRTPPLHPSPRQGDRASVDCRHGRIVPALTPSPVQGQAKPPAISDRQFTDGSIKVTVGGSTTIDTEIAINTKASFAGGGSTWLQYGVSGAEAPNVLVTYGEEGEVGITVGKGKFLATAGVVPGEQPQCTGKTQVTAALVSGDYTCAGVTSKQASGGLGTADITVRFTAET